MANILLIEDEALVREMLADELAVMGHTVIEADNGEEGLKKVLSTDPDLILCDRAMPGMSGYDLLAHLRNDHPELNDIPFVFLTALSDPRDKEAVEHLAPAAYIEKPVDFNSLGQRIEVLTRRACSA